MAPLSNNKRHRTKSFENEIYKLSQSQEPILNNRFEIGKRDNDMQMMS